MAKDLWDVNRKMLTASRIVRVAKVLFQFDLRVSIVTLAALAISSIRWMNGL